MAGNMVRDEPLPVGLRFNRLTHGVWEKKSGSRRGARNPVDGVRHVFSSKLDHALFKFCPVCTPTELITDSYFYFTNTPLNTIYVMSTIIAGSRSSLNCLS